MLTKLFLLLWAAAFTLATPQRAARYVAFDPPLIFPSKDYQTVKAGTSYGFRCESGDATAGAPARGISWRLPVDATPSLRKRVHVAHRTERSPGTGQFGAMNIRTELV